MVEHWTSDNERFQFLVDIEASAPSIGYRRAHTDGKGQTTRLLRTARGLPSSRQDAKGQRIRYEYDPAIRLTALVNENNAAYQFAYDASDRLIEEKRIDNLTRRFSYNLGGHLTQVDETGYGERGERPNAVPSSSATALAGCWPSSMPMPVRIMRMTTATVCCRSSACRPRKASNWVSAKKRWNSPTTRSAG
jgi:YD repeat-containing protein